MIGHNKVRFCVASNQQEVLHALSIRAIVYAEDGNVPMNLALDGNDYCATHALIYLDDEPIGGLRVRWFRDFAKIERTAIRKNYRDNALLLRFAEFIFDHIARKGYDTVVTHAEPIYARLWKRKLNFKEVEGKTPAQFDGQSQPYIELVKKLTVPANAISLNSDASVLFRPEGRWDEKSRYEA